LGDGFFDEAFFEPDAEFAGGDFDEIFGFEGGKALKSVLDRLSARASDADLESLTSDVSPRNNAGQGRPEGQSGRDFGQSHRPANAGRPATAGPPAGVPGNAGNKGKPTQSHKPPPKS
jgi:hypothetical protein